MNSSEMQQSYTQVQINSEWKNWIGCYNRPERYVYGASLTSEYLRHRNRSNKVKASCTLFYVIITYAIHVEQTLTHVTRIVWLQETVQHETTQFIDSTCTSMHIWFIYVIYDSQFLPLSDDQNKVFEYLVLQSLHLTAYFRKSTCQKIYIFFLFQHLNFAVWLLCIRKLFHFEEHGNITRNVFNELDLRGYWGHESGVWRGV